MGLTRTQIMDGMAADLGDNSRALITPAALRKALADIVDRQDSRRFLRGSTSQSIGTTFAAVGFGNGDRDDNTFSYDPWDAVNKAIIANPNVTTDENLNLRVRLTMSNVLLATAVSLKLEVPSPTPALVDEVQVPFTPFSTQRAGFDIVAFTGANWRQYGCRLYAKTNAGSVTITATELLVAR